MNKPLPTIQEVLEIDVELHGDMYRANSKILPGTPPVGTGKTVNEARYNLLCKILWEWDTWECVIIAKINEAREKL